MKVAIALFLSVILLSAFDGTQTLKGKWTYAGDIFNGKKEGGPTDYTLQRKYDDTTFTAYVIQKGYETEKYETGTYSLTAESTGCNESCYRFVSICNIVIRI